MQFKNSADIGDVASVGRQSGQLYRTLWRWHFYAGLFCIPLIMTLSITGAIYLFKPQIENWREQAYSNIEVGESRATPNKQIALALAVLPNAKFRSYRIPRANNEAVRVSVSASGLRYFVYVDPYTLKVMEVVELDTVFIEWIKNIHGELLAGKQGSLVVELAACWAIVLLITGLYLWWPRNRKGFAGVLYPRISRAKRALWKDIHAIIGIWVSVFALFLLISGLPWTTVWGGAFKESRNLLANLSQASQGEVKPAGKPSWRVSPVTTYDLSAGTLATAEGLGFVWPSELSVSDEAKNTWKLASMTQNRPLRKTAWINGNTAEVSRATSFSDKSMVDRLLGIAVAAHEGQLFGWVNQLLGLLTASGLVALGISGFVMWRYRNPRNQLGAPNKEGGLPLQHKNWLIGLIAVAGLLLPLLGASILVLVVLERAVLARIPGFNRWFGLSEVQGRSI